MFDFYYQHGNSRRKLFQVAGTHCSIGSARSNDLVIDSRQMSKRQAELRLEDSGVYLRDLGSLTGCWVNRERVVDYGPLSEFDEVEVGSVSVSVKAVRRAPSAFASARVEDTGYPGTSIQRVESEPASVRPSITAPASASALSGGGAHDESLKSSVEGNLAQQANHQASTSEAFRQASSDTPATHVIFDETLSYWGRIVHEQLLYQMDLQRKDVNRMSDAQLRTESSQLIKQIIGSLREQLPDSLDQSVLARNVLDESVGLGPLEEFLADESITEIMVNNHRLDSTAKCNSTHRVMKVSYDSHGTTFILGGIEKHTWLFIRSSPVSNDTRYTHC